MRRRDVVVLVIVLAAVAAGAALALTDGGGVPDVVADERQQQGLEDLAAELGCGGVRELDHLDGPIRGGAATRGVACAIGPDEAHIFQRAPLGDLDPSKSYADRQGGSLENIDRLVGTGATAPCLSLLVGRDWFILANDDGILRKVERSIGGVERSIVRATPPASYVGPGGCQATA